jgi:hypothetical protein
MSLRAAISAAMLLATRGVTRARWRENWRAYTGVMREAVAVGARSETGPSSML